MQRPDGQSDYRERTERRREPNISIYFCIYCPLLTGSWQLKVTAITSLEAEGRKRRWWVKRLAHSHVVSSQKGSPVFSALVVGNKISGGHLIFLVIMFLMFSGSGLPVQSFFFFSRKANSLSNSMFKNSVPGLPMIITVSGGFFHRSGSS